MSTRTPGKYGRRPPKGAPSLWLSDYLPYGRPSTFGTTVPVHPVSDDNLSSLTNWKMLGNDEAGDCVAVTWANVRRLVSTILGTASYPSQDEVWTFYETQNPEFDPNGGADTGPGSEADQGMDIQTALEDLVKNGGPDGVKALAFAQVDHTNLDEVKAAIALFGFVWTGLTVLDINQNQFSDNEPWNYSASSAVDGGHSVVTGGYGTPGAGALGGDARFITWAEETSFTDEFWAKEVEEAWVVIFPEHMGSKEFLAGVNLSQLAVDYQELTGDPFPNVPTPPVPPQPPQSANAELWSVAGPWSAQNRTRPDLVALKAALQTWKAATPDA